MRCTFKTTDMYICQHGTLERSILVIQKCHLKHRGYKCKIQRSLQFGIGQPIHRYTQNEKTANRDDIAANIDNDPNLSKIWTKFAETA